jgi:hypothetical protein
LPLLPQPFGLFLQRLYMALLLARPLEVKTTMSTERKISGLIFQSRVNFTFGPTCATTPQLLGAVWKSTPCSGSTAVPGSFLRPMTIHTPSTPVVTPLRQRFASPCLLATIECALASAAATQRLTALTAGTTT